MSEAPEQGSARHRATSPGRRRATPPPPQDDELNLFGDGGQYGEDPVPRYQSDALGEYLAEELEAGQPVQESDYFRTNDRRSPRTEDVAGYLASDDPGYPSGPAEPHHDPYRDSYRDPLTDPLAQPAHDPLSEPHDPLTDPLADPRAGQGNYADESLYRPAASDPTPEPERTWRPDPEPEPQAPPPPAPLPPAEDQYAARRAIPRDDEPISLFGEEQHLPPPAPPAQPAQPVQPRSRAATPGGGDHDPKVQAEDAGLGDLGFRSSGRVRHRRFRGCLAVLIALAVLGGGIGFAVLKGQSFLVGKLTTPDYSGAGTGKVTIEVKAGETSTKIGATLENKDVVKSAKAFTTAAKSDQRSRSIQPGFYNLRSQMSAAAALALLLDPKSRVLERVTIAEGLRLKVILDTLSKQTKLPRADFDAALKNPAGLGMPAYAKKPEGFLYPATYDIDPGTTAESLLTQMVTRYNEEADQLGLVDGAKGVGRSPLQVMTIASLVQAEARRPEDFGKVARVIYNRLAKGQKLQFDSTVHYAVGKFDKVSSTAKDRASTNPYNTYKYVGLPPGPINAPGEDALIAALEPTAGDWLFFVTTNPDTGETKFATTGEQFEVYAQEFQQWCRDNSGRC
ncbi:endolytic transglycosylase MltG [Tenggerimyces flavus]|uniref:Endolytic murein transglycosylase n=1 Tax=Tenggerimyces flavus TaxID=1708749 RepID=A0ABV7YGI7_9ACTN|nr:endolytic transglycosylase MltG [Tenggerimyces flavus]MBM7787929.1 putative YceG family protein [Tenggerimyces flavus]